MTKHLKLYVARDSRGFYLFNSNSGSGILTKNSLLASRQSAMTRLDQFHQDGYITEVLAIELPPLTATQQKVLDDMEECCLEGTNPVETIMLFSQQVQGGYSGYDINNADFLEVVKRFTFWVDERRGQ